MAAVQPLSTPQAVRSDSWQGAPQVELGEQVAEPSEGQVEYSAHCRPPWVGSLAQQVLAGMQAEPHRASRGLGQAAQGARGGGGGWGLSGLSPRLA